MARKRERITDKMLISLLRKRIWILVKALVEIKHLPWGKSQDVCKQIVEEAFRAALRRQRRGKG